MIVTITIPDEVYKAYAEANPGNPRQAIQKQLERFQGVPAMERVILVDKENRQALERLFGVPIETPEKIVEWVKALVGLRVGDEVVPLREGQRKRLSSEAQFYKKDPGVYIRERVSKALDEVLGAY